LLLVVGMSPRIALTFLVLTLSAGSAVAGKRAGVTMPDAITVANKRLTLNGMGLREATFLKVDVYVAGLYVENVSSNPQTLVAADMVKQLVLRFVRDVGHDDIAKALRDGFKRNATLPVARLAPYMRELETWMPSFSDGDTMTLTYLPGIGVTVDVNGRRRGTISDVDFARTLLNIWLGPKPASNDLKKELLGHHDQASGRA
jgi:hypothetical protein